MALLYCSILLLLYQWMGPSSKPVLLVERSREARGPWVGCRLSWNQSSESDPGSKKYAEETDSPGWREAFLADVGGAVEPAFAGSPGFSPRISGSHKLLGDQQWSHCTLSTWLEVGQKCAGAPPRILRGAGAPSLGVDGDTALVYIGADTDMYPPSAY